MQALPSLQVVPLATAVCWTPVAALHESTVQGLPSSTVGVAPDVHCPATVQVSRPSQTVALSQAVPAAFGVWLTPPTGSQASVVHGFASSTVGGVPEVQAPAWQVSAPSQTVALLQEAPFGFAGFEQTPVVELHVPTSRHAP